MSEDTRPLLVEQRALRARAWRWVPGMADVDGDRVIAVAKDGELIVAGARLFGARAWLEVNQYHPDDMSVPDLTDPATLGCLAALVREAWGTASGRVVIAEAEALVSAMEDAPWMEHAP